LPWWCTWEAGWNRSRFFVADIFLMDTNPTFQVQERKGRSLTVEEVQEVVRQGASQFPKDRLNRLPDLKFKYVEEEEPEEFFIPYVWTLATQRMHWSEDNMRLFST